VHTGIIEIDILLFTLGFIFGGIISAIIVKFFINRKIKNLYNILNEANLHRIKIKKEQEKKMKVLRKITKDIYINKNELKNNSESAQYETFDLYLSDLNKILDTIGINQIAGSLPPS